MRAQGENVHRPTFQPYSCGCRNRDAQHWKQLQQAGIQTHQPSTMGDLAVLRTAKLAMTEGLITQDDFDQIKVAFLKAQQIKAGLDAGFIREEDYVQARDSFLHSLDFRTAMTHHTHAPAPATAPAPAAPATTSMPPPPPVRVPPINAPSIPASGGTGLTSRGSSGMLSASPTAAQAAAVGNALASARGPSPSGGASAGSAGGGSGSSGGGTVAVPTDLPRIGKPGASSGKVRKWILLQSSCILVIPADLAAPDDACGSRQEVSPQAT